MEAATTVVAPSASIEHSLEPAEADADDAGSEITWLTPS